jgi:hypothetical protein
MCDQVEEEQQADSRLRMVLMWRDIVTTCNPGTDTSSTSTSSAGSLSRTQYSFLRTRRARTRRKPGWALDVERLGQLERDIFRTLSIISITVLYTSPEYGKGETCYYDFSGPHRRSVPLARLCSWSLCARCVPYKAHTTNRTEAKRATFHMWTCDGLETRSIDRRNDIKLRYPCASAACGCRSSGLTLDWHSRSHASRLLQADVRDAWDEGHSPFASGSKRSRSCGGRPENRFCSDCSEASRRQSR